jgi:hypothetical protein
LSQWKLFDAKDAKNVCISNFHLSEPTPLRVLICEMCFAPPRRGWKLLNYKHRKENN